MAFDCSGSYPSDKDHPSVKSFPWHSGFLSRNFKLLGEWGNKHPKWGCPDGVKARLQCLLAKAPDATPPLPRGSIVVLFCGLYLGSSIRYEKGTTTNEELQWSLWVNRKTTTLNPSADPQARSQTPKPQSPGKDRLPPGSGV